METFANIIDDNGEVEVELVQYEEMCIPKFFVSSFPGGTIAGKLQEMQNIPYNEGDILLCTFPKTGTHWVNNLLNLLLYDGPIEDSPSYFPMAIDFFPPELTLSSPSPRVTHMHAVLKRAPVSYLQKAKKVLVVRNPKDALVSLYFHLTSAVDFQFKQSLGHFIGQYFTGPTICGRYPDYLNSMQKEIQENKDLDIHVVYYEDLKKDGLKEMRRLQKYLGFNHSNERLQAILDRCTVDRLRADVEEGRTETHNRDKDGKQFVYRKGEVGDWKNHFTVAQSEAFDAQWEALMKDSMFHFQYT